MEGFAFQAIAGANEEPARAPVPVETAADGQADNLDLRDLRRQYGITQKCLADMLGVKQATVSRWERKVEEIIPSRRRQLVDLFSNRQGRFDPMIRGLIGRLPFVAVFDNARRLTHVTKPLAQFNRLDPLDVVGRASADLIDLEWEQRVFGGEPTENIMMADHVHDLVGTGEFEDRINPVGIRNRRFRMQFEDMPDLVFNVLTPLPRHQKPRLLNLVTLTDLDDD